eukprot:m.21480 g.21480  ORF g.21480 m.21480 type:complete len:448 (+) comp28181_c0_seq2:1933-3276(+)
MGDGFSVSQKRHSRTCACPSIANHLSCTVVACGPPPRLTNGKVIRTSKTKATYSCNPGYFRFGTTAGYCVFGRWIKATVCLKFCLGGQTKRDRCDQFCTCLGGMWKCCRRRKEFASMTTEEKQRYINAVITASTQSPYKADYDQLLKMHETEFRSGIHGTDQFLPWHRWFILQYENILRRVDCKVTVPYWDWSLVSQSPFSSPIWGSESHHLGGRATGSPHCVRDGPFSTENWSMSNQKCLSRTLSGTAPGTVEVAEVLSFSPDKFTDFNAGLTSLHGIGHFIIGGTMFSMEAAYAPEFFLHHGFVDKIWADWQKKSTEHKEAHFSSLTTPMTGTNGVTAKQVIDLANQPGRVSVCLVDPPQDVAKSETSMRKLSFSQLSKISRPSFSRLTDTILDFFRVPDDKRKLMRQVDAMLRIGTRTTRSVDDTDEGIMNSLEQEIEEVIEKE